MLPLSTSRHVSLVVKCNMAPRESEPTMKLFISTAIAAFLLVAPAAHACDYPARAKIVNGSTATKDEMIDSQKSVKDYMAAMENYLACLEKEEEQARAALESADEEMLRERDEVLAKKHNAAVEEMEIVAAEFNEQVRAYKAQSD